MINLRFSMKLAALPLFLLTFTSVIQAQATRTWVSGVGDDANPCSRTAPCKTWAGAISKTAAGGEIDALDPGGFGALTITKAITLDGGGGQVASVLVEGTNGINVLAGTTDVVTLRNLRITGAGQSGTPGVTGIFFQSGAFLHVEQCEIFGFSTNGIDASFTGGAGQLSVENTTITDTGGAGIHLANSGGGTLLADIHNVRIWHANVGLNAQSNTQVTVRDSQISQNTFGIHQSGIASGVSVVVVTGGTLAFDSTAVQSSANGFILVSGNTFSGDNVVFSLNGGQIYTGGDNSAFSNGVTGTATATSPKI